MGTIGCIGLNPKLWFSLGKTGDNGPFTITSLIFLGGGEMNTIIKEKIHGNVCFDVM